MWWIYLAGALLMFLFMFLTYFYQNHSLDGLVGLIAGIWLLNSARTAYREDQKTLPKPKTLTGDDRRQPNG